MPTHNQSHGYDCQENGHTLFLETADDVILSEICGLPCGQTTDRGSLETAGLAVLRTDRGLHQGRGIALINHSFTPQGCKLDYAVLGTQLEIHSIWDFDSASGIWSRNDVLYNAGAESALLLSYQYRFVFSQGLYDVYAQNSHWSNENQGQWQPLHQGQMRFGCEGGRTTQGNTPFVGLRDRDQQAGLALHLLPQGNWSIRVRTRTGGGDCRAYAILEAGLADDDLRLAIAPGETVQMPRVLLQSLPHARIEAGASKLHAYVLSHLLTNAQPQPPIIYNTWFDTFEELDMARMGRQLETAKRLGCEVFVIDAGWYGAGSGTWSQQTGDWREKTDRAFFGRMNDFAERVRATGLGFGLWMEPERIGIDAPILAEHPDWFLPSLNGQFRPDLANPVVYEYILAEMSRLVETYGLCWMKVDFNNDFERDTSGAEYYAYYGAWYRLMDSLHIKYANVFFESCASGGMRSDLATLQHFGSHFISDSVNPVDAIRMTEGALLRLPPGRLGKWITLRAIGRQVPRYGTLLAESPEHLITPTGATWDRSITTTVDFAARVCMCGLPSLSGDIASLPEPHARRLAEHIAFYKQWREFIASSVAQLLTPPQLIDNRQGWAAIQLCNPSSPHSLLFVYRLDDGVATRRFHPQGLVAAKYCIQDMDGTALDTSCYTPDDLATEGISVTIDERYGAALICLLAETATP